MPPSAKSEPPAGDLGVVMSGGGARAAYQVGCLAALAETFPGLVFDVLTGVSAGAINAASLASSTGGLRERVIALEALWRELTIDQVFRVRTLGLAKRALNWGLRLGSGGHRLAPQLRGMVDTAPLAEFLTRALGADGPRIPGIAPNIARGAPRALAVTGSSYSTGQSVTWVQGDEDVPAWQRAHRISERCEIGIPHVMASAALPLLFPAVQVHGRWYGDGGMRLTAPLSPAIHLGARRVLAVSTRYSPSLQEASDRCYIDDYPPPAQVAGALLNAVFLDQLDADALRLERINRLLAEAPDDRRHGLDVVALFVLRPSRDLGMLANEFEARLPGAFRFLTRGLGTRETRSNDLLSLLLFQPDYVAALIELGRRDTERRAEELERFLTAPVHELADHPERPAAALRPARGAGD